MSMNSKIKTLTTAFALAALSGGAALAQEVTLRLHQFLPPQANVPALVLDVWAETIERESGGRIAIESYPAMALGGTPPELMDQVIDGIADIAWTVNGFTPGRFPRSEVFELPFFLNDARAASYAYWQLAQEEMASADYADVHLLATWVHGPGMFHTNVPVRTPEDLQGLKIRGGSRMVNDLLTRLGAEPVGMPVTMIPEALFFRRIHPEMSTRANPNALDLAEWFSGRRDRKLRFKRWRQLREFLAMVRNVGLDPKARWRSYSVVFKWMFALRGTFAMELVLPLYLNGEDTRLAQWIYRQADKFRVLGRTNG